MANAEHLALLQQGTAIWNDWRIRNPGSLPDLGEANLSRAKRGERTDLEFRLNLDEVVTPSVSTTKAAEMLHVGESTVKLAKQVRRTAIPEVIKGVESGDWGCP